MWNDDEIKALWNDFLRGDGLDSIDYGPLIRETVDHYPMKQSVSICFSEIEDWNREFSVEIIDDPDKYVKLGEEAMREFMFERKVPISIYLSHLPINRHVGIRHIRGKLIDQLISVEGLVRRTTDVRQLCKISVFRCKRCNESIRILQVRKTFTEPLFCPKDQGGCGRAASSTLFDFVPKESVFDDTQLIEVQEFPEVLPGGSQPESLTVYLDKDLVGQVLPGDRITFNGVLRSQQLRENNGKANMFDKYLECIGFQRTHENYEEIIILPEDVKKIKVISQGENLLGKLVGSIAPSIKGHDKIKLAIALQMFGGIAKTIPDGRLRGDIHILLVGDPGTAKSQLLSYVSKMSPRGILASGKTATAAGLTAAAVPDEHRRNKWTLEAGALVLGDTGTVCVDEMDKMNSQDRSSMHEAMEQQCVHITKAGIQATLPTRCSILGAANPKMGRFTSRETMFDEINMLPTLLDRFDMIFTIQDKPDRKKDLALAEHILSAHRYGEIIHHREKSPIKMFSKDDAKAALQKIEPIYSQDLLKKYITHAKKSIFPVMSKEVENRLKEYYADVRGISREEVVSCTPRLLGSLIRFSEACARAHL